MFCPICSQQQVSNDTRFCSRCGFLLTGVAEVIANGGVLAPNLKSNHPEAISPRKRGLKQGGVLTLSSFIIVPLLMLISVTLRLGPVLPMTAAIILFWGGILRMLYALLFESNVPKLLDDSIMPAVVQKVFPSKKQTNQQLPPQQSIPTAAYVPPEVGSWRDTNDLSAPPSVTEPTTKLLQKD